jgi:hypothetical protein
LPPTSPDHVTIARLRVRHQTALPGFLVASLKLRAAAGMVRVGTVALDGTKLAAHPADKANRTHTTSSKRRSSRSSGRPPRSTGTRTVVWAMPWDELPPALASRAGRLDRLRQAKAQLQAAAAARQQAYQQRRPPGEKAAHAQASATGGA